MVKRVLVAILAVLLLVVGGALATAAVWAHSAFDSNGVMRFDAGTIDPGPDARSTIIDVDRYQASVPYIGELGTTRLAVSTGEGSDPSNILFIGAAATPDVDTFVKGSAYAVALRDGSEWTTREVPGALIPPLPRDQTFWLAQDVGRNPGIAVPDDRPLTLVVMHPAGVPSGPLVMSIDFAIPQVARWVLGMAIAAGVLLIAGIVLLIVVVRMRGRRGRHEGDVVEVVPDTPVLVATADAPAEAPAVEAADKDTAVAAVAAVAEEAPAVEAPTATETVPEAEGEAIVLADAVLAEAVIDDEVTEAPAVTEPADDAAVAEAPPAEAPVAEAPVAETLFDTAPEPQGEADVVPEGAAEEGADPSATTKHV